MDYFFDSWQKALEEFQRNVTKNLEEIREYKAEIQQIKADIYSALNSGYYLRDDQRIVISAPEIVIGNVDRDGVLIPDAGSRVIIRGREVGLEAAGAGGSVHTRAASIRQTAVDPGIDGQEAVVGPVSEVVAQAGQIVLEGEAAAGAFSRNPRSAGSGGVRIHADGQLSVEASVSAQQQKTILEDGIKQLEEEKKQAEEVAKNCIKAFEKLGQAIKDIYDKELYDSADELEIRTSLSAFGADEAMMQGYAPGLYDAYQESARSLSRLAEINRRLTCLKGQNDALPKPEDFNKKPTGAGVSIVGERVDIASRDGDGGLRANPEAGVRILANDVRLEAAADKGSLQKEGKVLLRAQTLELSTRDAKECKVNDKEEIQSGQFPAVGEVLVHTKTLTVDSVDMECKDGKMEEKALTKEGSVSVRVEKTDVSATDTEGKATGSIALNAKEVAVRSMDVDKEKRTDDSLAAGSTMLLLSEKMFVGAKKKDIKSKKVQVSTEEAGLFADKTLELQQGEAKAVVQLADGKAAVSGSEANVFGKTTVTGKMEVKDELKAPKATVDHVEAKSSFKSSNISDGIPVPPPPASGSLSAKLKAEDAPEKQQ